MYMYIYIYTYLSIHIYKYVYVRSHFGPRNVRAGFTGEKCSPVLSVAINPAEPIVCERWPE